MDISEIRGTEEFGIDEDTMQAFCSYNKQNSSMSLNNHVINNINPKKHFKVIPYEDMTC